jgi:hypothetical protein
MLVGWFLQAMQVNRYSGIWFSMPLFRYYLLPDLASFDCVLAPLRFTPPLLPASRKRPD